MENKEIMQELEGMKADLLESLKGSTNETITAEVKKLEEKFEAAQKDGIKQEDFDGLKSEMAKLMKDIAVLSIRVKEGRTTQPEQTKSFNDQMKEAVENATDDIAKFAKKEVKSVSIELKAVADTSTANVTGGSVWGAQYKPGIITNPNQIMHIRNSGIIPVAAAGAGTDYYFMKENGVGEGAPAPTSEKQSTAATTQATGLKPQFDIDLVESSVRFETTAGFMLLSNKALSNIPNLLSFLSMRVPEKLLEVEDAQILYGSGTTPNIKGLLVSGNFTAGSAAGTTVLAEKIINDLSLMEDTHKRVAAGIWVRPADYWSFFKNKASGSGEYDLPFNFSFVNGQLYAAGVPVYKTTALTANDYVIGAAGGADLLIQEAMRMEFFREDGTNVRTNQVTLRIEETIALPVYGSNYFFKGSSALA